MSALSEFLVASNLLPHGHCLFWRPDLLLLHVISDALIALAYFSIPLALLELLRRRKDLVFNHVFLMFAAFIMACGLTHVFNVADVWLGMYPLSGLMKAFTAFISVVTAVACWKLLPAAVALPSPTQLQEEVTRRKHAEHELRGHNNRLELRVAERTAEITQINEQLTEEIEARVAAQERSQFLAEVVEWSDDAIVRVDTKGIIQSWNKGAETLYGYSADEIIGQSIEITFPDDEAGAETLFSKLLENPISHTREVRRVAKDGTVIHVLLTISPIRHGENEKIIGFAGISRSIQERIESEQALMASSERLMKINAELKNFVYIASHDLQEPLRLIISYLTILQEDYSDKLDEDGIRYIGYTVESGERLQQLINDLLGYSRLTTAKTEMGITNPQALIQHVQDDLKLLIEEKSAEITVSPNLPELQCDAPQLRLVFQNLISNALKYCGEGTTPKIDISATQDDVETCFKITDNGIGFEQRQADRIFQVFRRLHPRHHYSGTGIGLAICKKVLERHGGRIWAESEVGAGSTFYFSIPRNIDSAILAE